ncbi:MAG: efflux RND transporter permease subunit [bacterium]|nr:efflux RND transporter permease subunit [bacterium]
MQKLIEYFLHRSIFVNLLTLILLLVGGYIAVTLNREAFPNIDFDLVVVTTVYPGASPREVEKLLTIPLEESIKEVDGVEEYRSSSIESRSSITIKIDPDVDDTQKVVDDVRSAVDRTEDLPDEAEKPILTEPSTSRQPIIQWSLAGPVNTTAEYEELRRQAERLENEFLAMPEVARVQRRGWLDREIFVDVDPDLLAGYYIDTEVIRQSLAQRNVSLPGGDINLGKKEVIIRTVGEFEKAEEISRLFIRSNEVGASVQLRDVARVREAFEEQENLESTNGVAAIGLTVVKRQSADIISTSNKTKRIVMDFAPQMAVIRTPYPGRDAATVGKKITKPLEEFVAENFQRDGPPIFGSPALVSRAETSNEDGVSVLKLTLNPDYIDDGDLDDRVEIYEEMFEELKEELSDARSVLPDDAGDFSVQYLSAPDVIVPQDVNDISYLVKRRLGVLVTNGVTGLFLVIGSLFLFMGWRTSVMVALGIPIAFGMTFMAMSYLGVTMNLIAMFSLVIVIGIVVDDAIIVSENIYRYMEEGFDFFEAAAKGAAEVFSPVLATISTTIAAFAPMMFMTGIFGKFVYTIPLVIILALVSSLLECFTILPSHVYDMNKLFPVKQKDGQEEESSKGSHWFERFRANVYRPALSWSVHHRWIFILTMVVMMFVSVGLNFAFGSFKLFPSAIDALYVKVSLPSGLSLEQTDRYLRAIGHEIRELPKTELDTYIARAGIQQKEGNDPFVKRGGNYGMAIIYLHPELDRKWSADEVIAVLRARTEWLLGPEAMRAKKERDQPAILAALEEGDLDTAFRLAAVVPRVLPEFADLRAEARPANIDWMAGPDGLRYQRGKIAERILKALEDEELSEAVRLYLAQPTLAADALASQKYEARGALEIGYEKLAGGPPVGKDIAVEITGEDLATLETIAEEYKEIVRSVDGVEDVDDDFLAGKEEIRLRIDEELASQVGLSILQIASAVNTAFEGAVATSIKRPEEEVDIRVRFAERFRNDRESLKKIYVSNRTGNLIPVSNLARFEDAEGLTVINHVDGKRLITVTANVNENITTAVAANREIAQRSASLADKYPNYKIAFSGQNKDTEESLASLGRAFVVAVFVIFMILASLFRSLIQPVVVLLAVPFSLIGVILAFLLHGEPFSFLAFMGIIGLSGVVVNDSIVLVDFANRIRETRPELTNKEVAVEAASVRLRAVLLTTLTTVAGLLPTAYGIGGYDPFLVPMALSFAWGLAFATLLTLGLVPIFYSLVLDMKDGARRLWQRFVAWRQGRKGHGAIGAGNYAGDAGRFATDDRAMRTAEYGLGEEYQIHTDAPSSKAKRKPGSKGRGSRPKS